MITFDRIGKRFGQREVLKEVSFQVERGAFTILQGPSGIGKTLLLAILAGLEKPTSGSVWIDGQDMTRVAPERRPVTMVFQRHALFPHLTVFDNIAFSLRAQHRPRDVVRKRVEEVIALIGLGEYARARPDMLSGGQSQRVAIARALASDAEVVLFDEPLNSLDRPLKHALIAELKRLHHLRRFTALYVTHDGDEATRLGERILHIGAGGSVRESSSAPEAG